MTEMTDHGEMFKKLDAISLTRKRIAEARQHIDKLSQMCLTTHVGIGLGSYHIDLGPLFGNYHALRDVLIAIVEEDLRYFQDMLEGQLLALKQQAE